MGLYIPLDLELISKVEPKNPTLNSVLVQSPKLIGIYYSMHNCPPCQAFTPLLADLYEETNQDEKNLEIVIFSGDKTEEEFNTYFADMPWLALPRD
jgi:thiol-disulfide isomerase/thioredoxin